MALQIIILTSSHNIVGFFKLRQKTIHTKHTHFDIQIKFIRLKRIGELLLWIWINKTKWINDVTKSLNSSDFSVLVLITILRKMGILGLAMLI